mgnify:CR=1 FL=1
MTRRGGQREKREVENKILERFGCRSDMVVVPVNVGAAVFGTQLVRFMRKGFADLLFLIEGGRTLFVECKTKVGRQSKDQKRFERIVSDLGFVYILARSPEDVARALSEHFNIEE